MSWAAFQTHASRIISDIPYSSLQWDSLLNMPYTHIIHISENMGESYFCKYLNHPILFLSLCVKLCSGNNAWIMQKA